MACVGECVLQPTILPCREDHNRPSQYLAGTRLQRYLFHRQIDTLVVWARGGQGGSMDLRPMTPIRYSERTAMIASTVKMDDRTL
jgi:hypothetical protein